MPSLSITPVAAPNKLRIEKAFHRYWQVVAPQGMWFDADLEIGRPNESPVRIFPSFPAAVRFVASGAAQRAVFVPRRTFS